MVLVATWNVNSIRQRLDQVRAWLRRWQPDVVCLQEIKCRNEVFPEELEQEGYSAHVVGQKTFNGVAILTRHPCEVNLRRLAGDDEDDQARYLEVFIQPREFPPFLVGSVYLPNGNPVNTSKFSYKLEWMDRLDDHVSQLLTGDLPFVLAGDFNIIPSHGATFDEKKWWGDALYCQLSLDRYRSMTFRGLTSAVDATHDGVGHYTFWDYTAGAYRRNKGVQIDHILLSPDMADRLTEAGIERDERAAEKPSDHVPVWAKFA